MIPAGYLAKYIKQSPDWLGAPHVDDIYSVSACISDDFADYINYWQHNGYWLFDSPEMIRQVAKQHSISLSGTRLFYYEVYEYQFDERTSYWDTFYPEPSFSTTVEKPSTAQLEGYDVVSFCAGTAPECSPLSCNGLAQEITTNSHCLLSSFEEAKNLLEKGKFIDCEPGPYRIFAVYSVKWP